MFFTVSQFVNIYKLSFESYMVRLNEASDNCHYLPSGGGYLLLRVKMLLSMPAPCPPTNFAFLITQFGPTNLATDGLLFKNVCSTDASLISTVWFGCMFREGLGLNFIQLGTPSVILAYHGLSSGSCYLDLIITVSTIYFY